MSGQSIKLTVPAQARTTVKLSKPNHYWADAQLHLCPGKECVDGANEHGARPTVPKNYVEQLQADLSALGYLDGTSGHTKGSYDRATARAVRRFRRHAGRTYRMSGGRPDDVAPDAVFTGGDTSLCDARVAAEIRAWVANGWKLPLGRFRPKSIITEEERREGCPDPDSYRLREDAADAWMAVVRNVRAAGGRLGYHADEQERYPKDSRPAVPYTSTPRPITAASGAGASPRSFHYAGRAVDVAQFRARGALGTWFVVQEDLRVVARKGWETQTFWIIYCRVGRRTDRTELINAAEVDGRIVPLPKGDPGRRKYIDFYDRKTYEFPSDYYVNLTALITEDGTFERIPAHRGWETKAAKHLEWWHFNYTRDKQPTFLDECELFGISEKDLLRQGWDVDALDGLPG